MHVVERRRRWPIVAGALVAHAVPFGLIVYSFTVFVPSIQDEFGRGQGAVAWIVSLATALMLAAGGIAGALTDRFGPRRVLVAGAVLTTIGMGLASAAGSVWHLIGAYGFVAGAGSSMTFIPAIAAVGRVFQAGRGLALGLATAGSGVGAIVFAPIATALIDSYGWRPALRVLAIVSLLTLLAAAALMPPRAPLSPAAAPMGDIRRTRTMRLLVLGSFAGAFGYWVPFVFMAPYVKEQGLPSSTGATIVAVMGVGNTLGRVALGWIADRAGRLPIMRASNVVMAVAMLAWPLATSAPALVAFGIVYALAAGAFIALLPALAGDYFGPERLGSVTGHLFAAAAIGTLVSTPLGGLLFDVTGAYTLATTLAATTLAIGAVPLFLLPRPTAIVAKLERRR